MTHTPTPWYTGDGFRHIVSPKHDAPIIASFNDEWHGCGDNWVANREFILRAVNAHDALVAACKRALQIEMLRDAISQNYAHLNHPRATVESERVAKANIAEYRLILRGIREQLTAAIQQAEDKVDAVDLVDAVDGEAGR